MFRQVEVFLGLYRQVRDLALECRRIGIQP